MSRLRLIGLLLALITLVVYLPVGSHGFIGYDDDDYITNNPIVQKGLTWVGIKWAFTTWFASNWHPLTWISHMLDCQLFGLNPGAQHLVNVLFHIANSLLLLFLLFRLTNSLWPSAMIAALFAWHPLHVESVAWISERKDVLSTFFELLALLTYVRYAKEHRRGSFWVSLLFFALALLSKPMPVTLPFVLLLLDYWPLQRFGVPDSKLKLQNLILEKWPFFLLSAASCVVTFLAQHASQAVLSLEQFPLRFRVSNALLSYVKYLWKTIWPAKLAVSYPLQPSLPASEVWMAVIFLLVVTWLVRSRRRQNPYLFVGWLWYLGTLVPVIGFVQVGVQAMADRYTYFPLTGIFIAVVWGIKDLLVRLQVRPVLPAIVGGLILCACLWLTERQLSYWANDETLFGHAVAVTKNNDIAYINLGVALEKKGLQAEALADYRKALRINPRSVEARNNLANFLDKMGKPKEALELYQQALQLNPKAVFVHDNMAELLVELGRFNEAMNQYEEASRLNPADPRPHFLMGHALLKQGRVSEAVSQFHEALQLDPNDFQSLTFLARILASDENPQIRNGAEAVILAEKANILTDNEQPFVLDTFAMACAETGHFTDAQKAEEYAIKLATTFGHKEDADEMQQRLKLYKNKQPYRQSFTETTTHSSAQKNLQK
jgi:protein O-mannosyl-transferase